MQDYVAPGCRLAVFSWRDELLELGQVDVTPGETTQDR